MFQIPEIALHKIAHYMRDGDKLPRDSHCILLSDATYTGVYQETNSPKSQWNTHPKKALIAYSRKGEFLGVFISFIDLDLKKIKRLSVTKPRKESIEHYKYEILPMREPIRKKFQNAFLTEKELAYKV